MQYYIYNTSSTLNVDILGEIIHPQSFMAIPIQDSKVWANSIELLTELSSGSLQIATAQDPSTAIVGVSDSLDLLRGEAPVTIVQPAFSDKHIGGRSLFARAHGSEFTVLTGTNTLEFTVPHPYAKFNELEVVGGEIGDFIDFKVLDTSAGTYSTIPNYILNQFGFSVYVSKDYYKRKSSYDADLYQGMRLVAEYNSLSDKSVYVNYILHEVK